MPSTSLVVEAILTAFAENPEAVVLALFGFGVYYELHHGKIAVMAENQYILGTAVYRLLVDKDDVNEEQFRENLWETEAEDPVYPRDWDTDPKEPPRRRSGPSDEND